MIKLLPTLLLLITATLCRAQLQSPAWLELSSAGPHQYTSPEEIAEYKALAEQGNIRAMGYLGDMYSQGEATVPVDCAQALKYYHMAIDRGDSSSTGSLATCYFNGICVAKDFKKAEELYLRAAQKGSTQCMVMIGIMHEAGMTGPASYDKALEWYFKAAANPVEIFYSSGRRTDPGFSTIVQVVDAARILYHIDSARTYRPIDTLKTFNAFKAAAEKGDKHAMMAVSCAYYSGIGVAEDTATGRRWMLRSANAGSARAMYELANMNYDRANFNGPTNNQVAAQWFLKAAEHGYVDGMTTIAIMYYHGRGIAQDYEKALNWFLKAAAFDDALAMNNIGLIYMQGDGVAKDEKKAFEWFSKAAAKEYAKSMYYLGYLYDKSDNFGHDYKQAMEWYLKAAWWGNNEAIDAIGKLYEDGKGVPQDYAKAAEWYSKVRKR